MKTLTFFHGPPTKTPSIRCPAFISVEIDLNFVSFGCYDLWVGVAAAVVHQSCPVPIGDLDKVAWAGGDITMAIRNSKVGELQPQYLATLHFYCLRLVEVVRVVVRVIW